MLGLNADLLSFPAPEGGRDWAIFWKQRIVLPSGQRIYHIHTTLYRGGGRASSPFHCYDCMWLHKLAGLLKPLGGTIKENLALSPHFSSSFPISLSMHLPVFFAHMKYEAPLIHPIQLIRQDGSAKARVKIQQYLLPLCRSGSNKRRRRTAVKEPFSKHRH